ncbi:MAG: glycosyltransferase [Cyclobacteriaceae bacterium]
MFASQLSNHLEQKGHNVSLISIFGNEQALPFNGEIIHLNRPLGFRFWDLRGWYEFSEMIKSRKPDIIQANAADTLKFAILSKFFFRWTTPVVFRNASTISAYIRSRPALWFNRFLLRKTTFIVSVSDYSRNDFLSVFPLMKNRIETIPVGLEMGRPLEASKQNYLIHVGGFTFEKNHQGLLRIMKSLIMDDPGLQLLLVGDGPLFNHIVKLAAELGIEKNVKFLGYRQDVLPLIVQARVLLLPSLIEGLPAVVLEAMFLKVPVVAYDVGGISELIDHDKTGLLVTRGDEIQFKISVQKALHDVNADGMLQAAFDKVTHNFDNSKLADRFITVFEELI